MTAHFGGISGIDFDSEKNDWVLISDDKSEFAPARFYSAQIRYDQTGFKSVQINSLTNLLQKDERTFPNPKLGGDVPDPESIRVDPRTGQIWWTSEGDRKLGLNPFVRKAERSGRFAGELPLPASLAFHSDAEIGPRHNLTIEGLSFTPNGDLWLAMEAPLYQDGSLATLQTGAAVRFTKMDRSGKVKGQYVYLTEPIPMAPIGGKKRADNGVSEVLAINENTLLVVERSGYEVDDQVFQFYVRLYEAKIKNATDVALAPGISNFRYKPMTKRLIFDLNTANIGTIDNIEGASWGPRLSNGNASLLLVSDDNFSEHQVNQLLLFEVLPQ